jgi:ribosomal protein S18 acetylase RimI-like enzyme
VYLRLLGVEPSDQGRGFGAALLQHGLYLETFAERNVPFYLRHGFELVVDEVERHSGIHTPSASASRAGPSFCRTSTSSSALASWGFYRPAQL